MGNNALTVAESAPAYQNAMDQIRGALYRETCQYKIVYNHKSTKKQRATVMQMGGLSSSDAAGYSVMLFDDLPDHIQKRFKDGIKTMCKFVAGVL